MPAQDKLYYNFITGAKDARKLYQSTQEMISSLSIKNTKDSFDIMVNLSKKLTDNAYFSEAKLFNQLASSEYQGSHLMQEEAGRVAFVFEDYKQCIELNKKAINIRNQQGLGGQDGNLSNIGLAYFELHDFNEALTAFEQALRMNPKNTSALLNQAIVYKQLGDFEKAVPVLETILKKIDPKDSLAMNNLANILHEQGKYESAAIMYL